MSHWITSPATLGLVCYFSDSPTPVFCFFLHLYIPHSLTCSSNEMVCCFLHHLLGVVLFASVFLGAWFEHGVWNVSGAVKRWIESVLELWFLYTCRTHLYQLFSSPLLSTFLFFFNLVSSLEWVVTYINCCWTLLIAAVSILRPHLPFLTTQSDAFSGTRPSASWVQGPQLLPCQLWP